MPSGVAATGKACTRATTTSHQRNAERRPWSYRALASWFYDDELYEVTFRERAPRPRLQILFERDRATFATELNRRHEFPWPESGGVLAPARVMRVQPRRNITTETNIIAIGCYGAAEEVHEARRCCHAR
jgi:hypothetical protein